MFNAANILEALKNYIRTRGGTSNAYNIAEAVNDLNSIPQGSGGDIPPEVSNAVETHGMGWTSEEEVEGFDIQWDGNTEGLDVWSETAFKVSSDVSVIGTGDNLVGAILMMEGREEPLVLTEDFIYTTDNKLYSLGGGVALVAFEDVDTTLTKGIWFGKGSEELYVSRLYKEASTEEVVHQIDPKYITDAPVVVHFTLGEQGLKWDMWYDELQNITDRPIEGILTVDNGGVYNAQYDPRLKKFYIKTLEIMDNGTPIENVIAYIKAVAWDYGPARWEFVEVAPSSGGGMVVNVIGTVINNQVVLSGDKTYNEIWDAAKSGTPVIAITQLGEEIPFIAPLAHIAGPNYAEIAYFGLTWFDPETDDVVSVLTVNSDNEWTMYSP